MYTLIPFLDLDSYNIEPLRLLIDRNYVSKIADAFPAKVWFQMHLRCLEYGVAVVGNSIDNLIRVNGRSEAGEVHQIYHGVL
jgi:hypothetical protein